MNFALPEEKAMGAALAQLIRTSRKRTVQINGWRIVGMHFTLHIRGKNVLYTYEVFQTTLVLS